MGNVFSGWCMVVNHPLIDPILRAWASARAHRKKGRHASTGGKIRHRSAGLICLLLLLFVSQRMEAAAIYRWISPQGVVSYGGHPPATGRHITAIDVPKSPATPPENTGARPLAESPPPSRPAVSRRKILAQRVLINRLNLLSALQNYQHGIVRTHPPHRVFALPYAIRHKTGNAPMK